MNQAEPNQAKSSQRTLGVLVGDRAGERLEGWLEEPSWDDEPTQSQVSQEEDAGPIDDPDPLEDWADFDWPQQPAQVRDRRRDRDEDPWI